MGYITYKSRAAWCPGEGKRLGGRAGEAKEIHRSDPRVEVG